MQVRKWLISGEINYDACRICSLPAPSPEGLIPTPITLSVLRLRSVTGLIVGRRERKAFGFRGKPARRLFGTTVKLQFGVRRRSF